MECETWQHFSDIVILIKRLQQKKRDEQTATVLLLKSHLLGKRLTCSFAIRSRVKAGLSRNIPRFLGMSFSKAFEKLRKATASLFICVCSAVRQHGKTRLALWLILMKIYIWLFSFFRKYVETIQVLLNSLTIIITLYEDVFIFMAISRWILLRMKNVSNKSCRENQNTFYVQWLSFP